MESLRTDTIRDSESICPTISCVDGQDIDEITKQKEDELLYGTGDDGDEEDALSDDSLRLRLSDDEDNEIEAVGQVAEHNKLESSNTASSTDHKSSCNSDNVIEENNASAGKVVNQEECESGNVSVDESIMNDQPNCKNMNDSESEKLQVASKSPPPWPEYVLPTRNSGNMPRVRSFHYANHILRSRHHYFLHNDRYDLYNHHNQFRPFGYNKHGRGNGNYNYNSYMKEYYGDRRGKHILKSVNSPRSTNVLNDTKQTYISSADTFKSGMLKKNCDNSKNNITKNESEKPITENVLENRITKKESENTITKDVAENSVTENELENSITKNVAENSVVENELDNSIVQNVLENPITENELKNLIAENELKNSIAENVAENELENSITKDDLENSTAENEFENSIAENESENACDTNKDLIDNSTDLQDLNLTMSNKLEEKSNVNRTNFINNQKDDIKLTDTVESDTDCEIKIIYDKEKSLLNQDVESNVQTREDDAIIENEEEPVKYEENISGSSIECNNENVLSIDTVTNSKSDCSIVSDTANVENDISQEYTPDVDNSICDPENENDKEEEEEIPSKNATEEEEEREGFDQNEISETNQLDGIDTEQSTSNSSNNGDINDNVPVDTQEEKSDKSDDNEGNIIQTETDLTNGDNAKSDDGKTDAISSEENVSVFDDVEMLDLNENSNSNSTTNSSETPKLEIEEEENSLPEILENSTQKTEKKSTESNDPRMNIDDKINIDIAKSDNDVVPSTNTDCTANSDDNTMISVPDSECTKEIQDDTNTSSKSLPEKFIQEEKCDDETEGEKEKVLAATVSIEKRSKQIAENKLLSKENIEEKEVNSGMRSPKTFNQENTHRSLEIRNISKPIPKSLNSDPVSKTTSYDDEVNVLMKSVEIPTTQKRRRRTEKSIIAEQQAAFEDKGREQRHVRQKRRTARNAEEIIRKNLDSDAESSDSSEKYIIVNHKVNQDARCLSPPSLKRNCPDSDNVIVNGNVKKFKTSNDTFKSNVTPDESKKDVRNLNYIHKFFQRDIKEKLPRLKQEELEELLIQKIVETITMRSEIGRLREQARVSEKNLEVTRLRCQLLAKQIKDFEMVLNRNAADRRANNDKPTAPIKINRSVGLQVNFISDQGMQNLRQLQQISMKPAVNIPNGSNPTVNDQSNKSQTPQNAQSPRRGLKIKSPRRSETPVITQNQIGITQSPIQTSSHVSTVTPAALVVTKPLESQHTLTVSNQTANQQIPANVLQSQAQAIVLNGKVPNQLNRQNTPVAKTTKTNDLIDLTDEEEKNKTAIQITPVSTAPVTEAQVNITPQKAPCYQRVIQAIPGNVAITTQPLRVVQPSSQPTPTALVNNMNNINAPRLTYVMQSGIGSARQVLITSNSSQMRPATSCNRPPFTTLTYKTSGISTLANGTVRVLTTQANPNVQIQKHPAPLPDSPNYGTHPVWKLPPPAPSLKISKVANGIVLSWNMALSDKYADIASYQLYAYQEIAGIPPNTGLWKKVGDVRALPLPMACTLTQFSEGNNYHFAVRAVDTHSRKGQYSMPGNISL